MSALEFLKQTLTEKFGVPAESITPEANLQDLGLDSLSIVELVFEVEDEFDIEVSEEDAKFETLGGAIELIDRLVAEKG